MKRFSILLAFLFVPASPLAAQEGKVDDAWIEKVAALAPKEQAQAVGDKLKELNFKMPATVSFKEEEGKIVEFSFVGAGVKDITPLKALKHVKKLSFASGPPTSELDKERPEDLSNIAHMPLVELNIRYSKVKDLKPLGQMQLVLLDCGETPVASLAPIKGMPMETLDCTRTAITTFASLKALPLKSLTASYVQVNDLKPLKDLPITTLHLWA